MYILQGDSNFVNKLTLALRLYIMDLTRGVVYGAREAHNLTGWVQLPAPQQGTILRLAPQE